MDEMVQVRYMVNDVTKAVAFYTGHLGFTVKKQRVHHGAPSPLTASATVRKSLSIAA
jgi:catechol 2,3-dioxygenase-like lactoylglutathione lyase family enzyme